MKKRLLSLALCFCMAVGVLVGCGNSNTGNTEANSNSSNEETSKQPSEGTSELPSEDSDKVDTETDTTNKEVATETTKPSEDNTETTKPDEPEIVSDNILEALIPTPTLSSDEIVAFCKYKNLIVGETDGLNNACSFSTDLPDNFMGYDAFYEFWKNEMSPNYVFSKYYIYSFFKDENEFNTALADFTKHFADKSFTTISADGEPEPTYLIDLGNDLYLMVKIETENTSSISFENEYNYYDKCLEIEVDTMTKEWYEKYFVK